MTMLLSPLHLKPCPAENLTCSGSVLLLAAFLMDCSCCYSGPAFSAVIGYTVLFVGLFLTLHETASRLDTRYAPSWLRDFSISVDYRDCAIVLAVGFFLLAVSSYIQGYYVSRDIVPRFPVSRDVSVSEHIFHTEKCRWSW